MTVVLTEYSWTLPYLLFRLLIGLPLLVLLIAVSLCFGLFNNSLKHKLLHDLNPLKWDTLAGWSSLFEPYSDLPLAEPLLYGGELKGSNGKPLFAACPLDLSYGAGVVEERVQHEGGNWCHRLAAITKSGFLQPTIREDGVFQIYQNPSSILWSSGSWELPLGWAN